MKKYNIYVLHCNLKYKKYRELGVFFVKISDKLCKQCLTSHYISYDMKRTSFVHFSELLHSFLNLD